MAVNKKNIMTRYFFVILLMGLIGVAVNIGRMWPTVSSKRM